MANNIATGNFAGESVTVATTETGGVHTPHHRDLEAIALLQELLDAPVPSGAASETTLAAVLAKIIADPATEVGQAVIAAHIDGVEAVLASILGKIIISPATEASQTTIIGHVDGIEPALTTLNAKDFATQTTLAAVLAKLIPSPSTEAKQDTEIAAVNRIGTRAYGAASRVAVAAATAYSTAIAATEVLLHASVKQYIAVVAATGTPTVDPAAAIPLEAGEKFHMRITSGLRIATIRDTADGFLHIAPVV